MGAEEKGLANELNADKVQVESMSTSLKEYTKTASAKIDSKFLLPQLSASPENVKLDEKIDDLHYKIQYLHKMTPASFLEAAGSMSSTMNLTVATAALARMR